MTKTEASHLRNMENRFKGGRGGSYPLKKRLQYATENLDQRRTDRGPMSLLLEANTCFLVMRFILNPKGFEHKIPPEEWWGITARTAARYGLAYVKLAHEKLQEYKRSGWGVPPAYPEVLAKVKANYELAKERGILLRGANVSQSEQSGH